MIADNISGKVQIYVRKIWSRDPVKYKFIKLEEAIQKYAEYAYYCHQDEEFGDRFNDIKTFKEWLKTEI